MTNPARGEVSLQIDGRARTLCLTLGAMAEMEAAFGVEGPEALGRRLANLSARDLLVVLAALLRGGGEDEAADGLARARVDWPGAAQATAECFRAAFAQ